MVSKAVVEGGGGGETSQPDIGAKGRLKVEGKLGGDGKKEGSEGGRQRASF